MILGSHNSWSFRTPTKWWQKLLSFTARCQSLTIQEQYELGVRCFDLRLRIDKYYQPHIVHNSFDYGYLDEIGNGLRWLNTKRDVVIRVIHDVRKEKDYTPHTIKHFRLECKILLLEYPNIKFWCGRNLFNWDVDYEFDYRPTCIEKYSSVCAPKLIDDWWPWQFAKRMNHRIRTLYPINDNYDSILLIDYVNIK